MAITLSKDALNTAKAGEKAVEVLDRLQDMQLAKRLGKMLLLAAAIALGLMVFVWSQRPGHVPLYAGLDAKATAEATDLLRAANIPFTIDQGTGSISVPEDHIHDARLKLAGSGLTESGRLGFELMERDPGFGVSQFVETARYQHALETELVRTISALRPVRDARVHLAIPKPSAFTRQREAASASVVLDLRGGAALERGQVDAIVHLVASSIPDLSPERVTVVDQAGRLLSNDNRDPAATLSNVQFEQVRRQETSYNQRIRELLEPMTGSGRVNAEVTVDMDFSVSEEARELFNAEPPKLRSERTSENSAGDAGPQGIPGVTSNLPDSIEDPESAGGTLASGGPAAAESSRSATRNYELDRTLQHTRQPPGRIRRVTTAVLVDHVPRPGPDGITVLQPLSENELARIESLVRQAVGFDESRGDVVSVMNAPFVHEEMDAADPTPWWKLPQLRDAARLLLGAVVVLALLFGVVRPAIRQIADPAPRRKLAADLDVTEVEVLKDAGEPALAEDRAQISAAAAAAPMALASDALEDQVRQAREAVQEDSKRVAQVIRGWVSDDSAA